MMDRLVWSLGDAGMAPHKIAIERLHTKCAWQQSAMFEGKLYYSCSQCFLKQMEFTKWVTCIYCDIWAQNLRKMYSM